MSSERVEIAGTTRTHDASGTWSPVDPNQQIEVSIVLRRPPASADLAQKILAGGFQAESRQATERTLGAAQEDLEAVRNFASDFHLQLASENVAARTVQVQGSTADLEKAFGVTLGHFTGTGGESYISYEGAISLPASFKNVVEAVLGLDQRPVAQRRASTL